LGESINWKAKIVKSTPNTMPSKTVEETRFNLSRQVASTFS